jgi:hypothetical protein
MHRKPHTQETKEKISKANTGKKRTQATRDKMSKATKGKNNPNYRHGECKKIHYCIKCKIKPICLANWYCGSGLCVSCSTKGRVFSESHCKKIGDSNRGMKSHLWINGISSEIYPINWNKKLKESIRQRDNYECQLCDLIQNQSSRKLCVHHIDYNKDNLNPDNLISLCDKCHLRTNGNRDYYYALCKYILENK